MEVSWQLVTCLVIGFFAIIGFSRGWWKEGLTTIFLLILFIFLQQPGWAQGFIDLINSIINTIWNLIPDMVIQLTDNFVIDTTASTPPIQAEANSPSTWVVILVLFIAFSIFWGRAWLNDAPTAQGSVFGFLIGALNGFLVLNLVREYLDGRSLPGNEEVASASSQIVLGGGSAFGPPTTSVSIQATDLPNFTLLDSTIPWFIIAGGILITFAVFKTRFRILERDGMRKLSFKELPPFHAKPQKPKPKLEECLKIVEDARRGNS